MAVAKVEKLVGKIRTLVRERLDPKTVVAERSLLTMVSPFVERVLRDEQQLPLEIIPKLKPSRDARSLGVSNGPLELKAASLFKEETKGSRARQKPISSFELVWHVEDKTEAIDEVIQLETDPQGRLRVGETVERWRAGSRRWGKNLTGLDRTALLRHTVERLEGRPLETIII